MRRTYLSWAASAAALLLAALAGCGEDALDLLMAGPVWRLFFDVMTGG